MGKRRMQILALMNERPRLSYSKIAEATQKQTEDGHFSVVTISRWMAEEPTEKQAAVITDAIQRIRKEQR